MESGGSCVVKLRRHHLLYTCAIIYSERQDALNSEVLYVGSTDMFIHHLEQCYRHKAKEYDRPNLSLTCILTSYTK